MYICTICVTIFYRPPYFIILVLLLIYIYIYIYIIYIYIYEIGQKLPL